MYIAQNLSSHKTNKICIFLRMMMAMGWKGQGLGIEEGGRRLPILVTRKTDRAGLGFKSGGARLARAWEGRRSGGGGAIKFCSEFSDSPQASTPSYTSMPPCTPPYTSMPPCTPPYTSPLPSTTILPPCRDVASTLPPYREAPSSLPPYTVAYSRLPPGSLFDSHCHLDILSRRLRLGPSLDLRQLVTSDPQLDWASFGGCVAVYCHPRDWRGGPSLSLQRATGEDRAHLALGCHPHYSNLWHLGSTKYELEAAMRRLGTRLVALGECGLDYTRKNLVAREQQMRVFREQVLLALRLDLPLVLHIREAEEDGLKVLEDAGLPRDWRLHRHCFTGGLTWM